LTKSSTTPDFWASYAELPPEVKRRARAAYRLWRATTRAIRLWPSRRRGRFGPFRIGSGYRALCLLQSDTFYWFWIGTHDEYERLPAEW